jgi:hypothetical protein
MRNIVRYLKMQGKSVAHRDVEESCGIGIRQLLLQPKEYVVEAWNRGLVTAVESLDDEAKVRLISCHLTLYDKHRSILFMPAVSRNFMRGDRRPSRILVFIDDIFDMASRLSVKSALFDASSEYERITARMTKALAESYPDDDEGRLLSDEENEMCRLDASVSILQRLLSWRRNEMIAAEGLALQLDVPLTLLGIKHPMNMIRPLLGDDEDKCVTYVSHPISRVRLEGLRNGGWGDMPQRLNQIPGRLAGKNVVSIMPTAIDEFRFVRPSQDNAFHRDGGMTMRWPLIESDDGLIGYDPVDVPESLEVPDELVKQRLAETSIYLRALEVSIANEIPFRDHFLVNHCSHFIAFRPRENGNWWSAGVKAEVEHFAMLADEYQDRRMVVVHDCVDVAKGMEDLQCSSGGVLKQKLESPLREAESYIRGRLSVDCNVNPTPEAVRSVLYQSMLPDSLLDEATISNEDIVRFRTRAVIAAREELLVNELTGLQGSRSWLRVIIVNTNGWAFLEDVADWLKGANQENVGLGTEVGHAYAIGVFEDWFHNTFEKYLVSLAG